VNNLESQVDQLYIIPDEIKITGAFDMKTIYTIMVLTAILSIPIAFGTQSAMAGAGSTGTSATVTISAVCELTAPSTLAFAAGDPETNGVGQGVGETAAFILGNVDGNLDSVVGVSGADMLDSVSPFDPVQSVGFTFYATTSSGEAAGAGVSGKTALTGGSIALTTITAGNSQNTFWNLEIALDDDATFAGTANQAILFDFTCV